MCPLSKLSSRCHDTALLDFRPRVWSNVASPKDVHIPSAPLLQLNCLQNGYRCLQTKLAAFSTSGYDAVTAVASHQGESPVGARRRFILHKAFSSV